VEVETTLLDEDDVEVDVARLDEDDVEIVELVDFDDVED